MKVLILTQYFWPEVGAPQTRLSAVARELVAGGHDVRVVTGMPSYPTGVTAGGYRRRLLMKERHRGATVFRSWAYPAMGSGLRRLVNYGSFALSSIAGLARAGRVDLIVIESPPLFLAVPGLAYARLRRTPSVLNVADLWPDAAVAFGALSDGPLLSLMRRLERWSYRNADVISTVTPGLVEKLVARGVPRRKLVMLPNGVDTDEFKPRVATEVPLSLMPDRPFLVYAGTMGIAHGIDPLIDAMKSVKSDRRAPMLLMLGSGSERPRLELRCNSEGIDNVIFRDPVPTEELAALLPHALAGVVTVADIGLNASTRPAKLFPLMAAGLPIVHAGPGIGGEMVRDADAGRAVDNDAQSIADAIQEIATSTSARERWSENARKWVEPEWSWRRLVAEWFDGVLGATDLQGDEMRT